MYSYCVYVSNETMLQPGGWVLEPVVSIPLLGLQCCDWPNLSFMTHFFNTTSTKSATFPARLTSVQKTGAVSFFKPLAGNHLTDYNMMSEPKISHHDLCYILQKKDDNYEQNCNTAITVPSFTKYPCHMNCIYIFVSCKTNKCRSHMGKLT